MKKVILVLSLAMLVLVGCGNNMKDKADAFEDNNYELKLTNGDRFFKSEIYPKSMGEKVALDYFKIQISDEYDQLKNILISDENYEDKKEPQQTRFENGIYTEEITIHDLQKIDKEIYSNESEAGYVHKMDMDRLKEHNPIQYEMIRIVYTNKLSEKGNDLDQNGNGTWASYYIVSKDQADSDWKVFDLYGLTSHDNN